MPIVNDGLRSYTITTEKDYLAKLAELYESLDAEEKTVFIEMMNDQKENPKRFDDFLYYASAEEYDRIPIPMREWLTDPNYMGRNCESIFPAWREDLIELFEARSYNVFLMSGGIGIGKTTIACIAILRMLYEASCLKNPAVSYGQNVGTPMYICMLAPSAAVAKEAVFEALVNMVRQSPYFSDAFPPLNKMRERFKSASLQFPKNLHIMAGSSSDKSILGKTVIGGFIDELNFFQQEAMSRRQHQKDKKYGIDTKAGDLYESLLFRMKSRFLKKGKMPGMLIAASSKTSVESITERIIKDATKNNDSSIFVRDRSIVDLKKGQFLDKKFKVLVGTEKYHSRILADGEFEVTTWDEDSKFVEVPEDFRHDFETNIDRALRDISGVSTMAMATFIKYPERVQACVDETRRHPFTCMTNADNSEWDSYKNYQINWSALSKNVDGVWAPILHPHAKRHVHLDPALTGDAFSLAIGCVAGLERRESQEEGSTYYEYQPHYHIDFILRIVGRPGHEVNFENVRALLYKFSEHGFHFSNISMDTFQSRDMAQTLNAKGYKTQIISVDESKEPYESLRDIIYQKRISYYYHAQFLDEIVRLEDVGPKIDHAPGGKKDCADAVAGVTFTLSKTAYHNEPILPQKGESIDKTNPTDTVDQELAAMSRNVEVVQEPKTYKKKSLPPSYNKGGNDTVSAIDYIMIG